MNGIIDSVLSMKLDVYRQIDAQDSDTGAIKREWIYHRTVDCHAKGVISNSATTRSSDKQVFDNKYKKFYILFRLDCQQSLPFFIGRNIIHNFINIRLPCLS